MKRRTREVQAGIREAADQAAREGAVGYHIVWILPGGEYGDAFDCDDVLEMTAAVNDSALKARIESSKGEDLVTANA